MRKATDLLVQYATYHRDRRNIATHFVGIPLIVFAVGVLLARPDLGSGPVPLTPGWIAWGAATLWYLTRGQLAVGIAVSLLNALLLALAHAIAGGSVVQWLGWGIGTLLLGWLIQGVGHYYEGRRPARMANLGGLLTAPMFVAAEMLFALGYCRQLLADIERRAGPTVLRDLHSPA